jgi:hypothetical protein
VQSTLILSRKDGSIISSTGLVQAVEAGNVSTQPMTRGFGIFDRGNVTEQMARNGSQSTRTSATIQTAAKSQATAAEVLASAIFRFVAEAGSLHSAIDKVTSQSPTSMRVTLSLASDGYGSTTPEPKKDQPVEEYGEIDEVQLLRLRTRKHEIIIYPDKHFLCCVIQGSGHSSQEPGDKRKP